MIEIESELKFRARLYETLRVITEVPHSRVVVPNISSLKTGVRKVDSELRSLQRIVGAVSNRDQFVEEQILDHEKLKLHHPQKFSHSHPISLGNGDGDEMFNKSPLFVWCLYLGWIEIEFSIAEDTSIRLESPFCLLKFMAYLAELVAHEDKDDIRDRILGGSRAFMQNHILPTLNLIDEYIASTQVSAYFKSVVAISLAIVEIDSNWLDEVLEDKYGQP